MKSSPTRFIILAAARTGSNLLRDLVRSHPAVFAGSELFNPNLVKQGVIPWYELGSPSDEAAKINSDPELNRLRQVDPGKFIDTIVNITHGWGYRVIGFKCMYFFPTPEDPAGRYLINDKKLHVIHLKRRNLLRRLVSWERALATDSWYLQRGESGPELPVVTLPIAKVVEDITSIQSAQGHYDACFKEHPMLEVFYEDLEQDPQAVGVRALNFLGLKASYKLDIRLEKTGVDTLREAIANYDELKSSLPQWASFFDE